VVWLGVAVVLGVAALFTLTAALGVLSGAALLTAGAAVLGLPGAVQAIVFALATATGLALLSRRASGNGSAEG
jgi:hypothetical protein